jgi:DNA-binding CsgD family transcriptional regulator
MSDETHANNLQHGEETEVLGDARYQGAQKSSDAKAAVTGHVTIKSYKRRVLNEGEPLDCNSLGQIEHDTSRRRVLAPHTVTTTPARLTPREIEVLKWHADGKTNAQISNILHITIDTVKFHTKNAIEKLGASNKTSAAVRATVLGLLD